MLYQFLLISMNYQKSIKTTIGRENINGYKECHIQPDWLLIYKIDKGELLLTAYRTGSHSDLF